MLFNSPIFLFVFLPLTWAVYYLLYRQRAARAPFVWLALMSLAYYGWWKPIYLVLLLLSKATNYLLGMALRRLPKRQGKLLLIAGIAGNLGLLIYFKYTGFIVANINVFLDAPLSIPKIVLPLAISFFTFQQIAYLVDIYQDKVAEHGFLEYILFVTFFPPLIAGPIVHHNEMMPQFFKRERNIPWRENAEAGLTLFVIGLFKKVVIADSLALLVKPIFGGAANGIAASTAETWTAALAYTLQLYFDFSGYSDMALGAAYLFGIRLPNNFYSPYQSANIIEFWRRWHMSLSRFLRDYLYIPLGGSRRGRFRRYLNLCITMLLGGIWHGASWTFVAWGALHGFYLVINHGWRALVGRDKDRPAHPLHAVWTRALTFLCVVIAWVFFRADSIAAAKLMLQQMFSLDGRGYSKGYLEFAAEITPFAYVNMFGTKAVLAYCLPAGIALCLAIVFWMPNSIQLMHKLRPITHIYREDKDIDQGSWWSWSPSYGWSLLAAIAAFTAILGLGGVSEFIYFNF